MPSKMLLISKVVLAVLQYVSSRLRLSFSSIVHRFTYRAISHPRDVVVIGASFAGYHTAHCLAHSLPTGYRVTVIERNSHFQLTWALPRFCVAEGHKHKAFIPYGPYLAKAPQSYRWIWDEVTGISLDKTANGRGSVQLRSGDSIDYDYLVGMEALQREQQRLKAGHNIVVVGGGPAGIELAADTKTQYPDKYVTLVHSHEALLNAHFRASMRQHVLTELETLGVCVILGERLSMSETGEVTLSTGEKIPCDCLIKCVGQKPNSNILPSSVSPSGFIQVRSTLQLANPAMDRVYAIIDMDIIKNGRTAFEQAQVVVQNIVRQIRGRQLVAYRPRWWEDATKLTVGLNKNLVYMNDGNGDLTIQ